MLGLEKSGSNGKHLEQIKGKIEAEKICFVGFFGL